MKNNTLISSKYVANGIEKVEWNSKTGEVNLVLENKKTGDNTIKKTYIKGNEDTDVIVLKKYIPKKGVEKTEWNAKTGNVKVVFEDKTGANTVKSTYTTK